MDAVGSIGSYVDESDTFWQKPSISLGEKPDPLQMESEVKKSLKDRVVVHLTKENKTTYQIDHCINIQTYTEVFCKKMAQLCEGLKAHYHHQQKNVVIVIVGVALFLPTSYKIYAVGVAALAWLSYWAKIDTVSREMEDWNKIRYQEPAEQRANAYLETFPSLYANRLEYTPDLRTGVLHPNEVEYLYKKYLLDFCQKLLTKSPSTPQEKEAWLQEFLKDNPLSEALMHYGFQKIPASFEQLGAQYNHLVLKPINYEMLRSKFTAFTHLIGQIGPIGRIGRYSPPTYMYDLEGLVVENEKRLERLKNTYLTDKEHLKAQYGKYLQQAARVPRPISSEDLQALKNKFDNDLKQLKSTCKDEMEEIKKSYLERLKHLKVQFSFEHGHQWLENHLEERWDRLKTILTEKTRSTAAELNYEKARELLELAQKEVLSGLV